jgi:hypothetical protein
VPIASDFEEFEYDLHTGRSAWRQGSGNGPVGALTFTPKSDSRVTDSRPDTLYHKGRIAFGLSKPIEWTYHHSAKMIIREDKVDDAPPSPS